MESKDNKYPFNWVISGKTLNSISALLNQYTLPGFIQILLVLIQTNIEAEDGPDEVRSPFCLDLVRSLNAVLSKHACHFMVQENAD